MYGEWVGYNRRGTPAKFRAVAGIVFESVDLGWSNDAVPEMAGWITSACRMELFSLIRLAGWDNVFYYDTDSLMVNQRGYDRLAAAGKINSGCLGSLEVRGRACSTTLVGIKAYVREGRYTCSGLPRGVAADAGDSQHYYFRNAGVDQIRGGYKPSGEKIIMTYKRTMPYHHGVVHPDGSVTPIILEEW
jgi:hypothetical protein